ncbi:hypothetical protein Ddye_030327 [Dipteronia dyeriana]|uniref:Zinc finger PHD-type domain-containing protein n=1 Tax=Dipteronia dyeriana TaxID=168575 RepID=A0AAD9WMK0_9ROSI|nr:hypothetical protein Ddye_030327 [Dipteronia dyeriana]
MAITTFEACKKRKRAPNIFTIHSFATPASSMDGPFRDNIRLFLQQCSEKEDYIVENNPVWCTLFLSETNGIVFPLYIVEQNVQQSSDPFCDLCRCVGWSHHFVSKRRYHLIIPENLKWSRPLNMDSIEFDTHLLHGVIHCNGFGHLLSINGTKDYSNYLCGEELMNLWDCLCSCLRTQKISVHDLLMKRGMDLRLLHAVAYGCPWFGDWGYKFCHGSFGVTEHMYNRAIQILRSLDLDKIIHDYNSTSRGRMIQQIINCYKHASETLLVTISDLLRFMLAFSPKPLSQRNTTTALVKFSSKTTPKQKNPHGKNTNHEFDSFESFVAKSNSRWNAKRLEYTAKIIVNILVEHARTNSGASVTRQELRDEARKHVGDTGLIDFLLKTIHKTVVEDRIVRRSINPITKLLEFYLQDVQKAEFTETKTESHSVTLTPETGRDVYGDMLKLYKNVLLGYPESHPVSLATRTILNSKNFVKEWQFKGNREDNLLRLICRIMPSYDELVTEFTRPLPPGEVVVVRPRAAVGEMKSAVQCALRDTYCVMDKFVVSDVKMRKTEEDLDRVWSGAGRSCDVEVEVRGCGLDLGTELRYEGGAENLTVDCVCGAKDDDGERMVACEICQVGQHTRCNSINDHEAVPCVFLCPTCKAKVKM